MVEFLTHLSINVPKTDHYPFNIPILSNGVSLEFSKNITFIIGENGSGKSTILEAIAEKCNYNLSGGNKNHLYEDYRTEASLYDYTTCGWRRKPYDGFFLRAESFYNFAKFVDDQASESPFSLRAYGDKSLHQQSHGESFLSLVSNKFDRGFFILDEPEAALSPMRQLTLINILNELSKNGQVQFIIATHSPILLCTPDADIFEIRDGFFEKISYQESEHFNLTKNFLNNPDLYLRHL
jgi:predicted ATPase